VLPRVAGAHRRTRRRRGFLLAGNPGSEPGGHRPDAVAQHQEPIRNLRPDPRRRGHPCPSSTGIPWGLPQKEITCRPMEIPAAFTRRGWLEAVRPALKAMSEGGSDWVMGSRGAGSLGDLQRSPGRDSSAGTWKEFVSTWRGVLDTSSCALPAENQRIGATLATLSSPYNRQNPRGIQAFFAADPRGNRPDSAQGHDGIHPARPRCCRRRRRSRRRWAPPESSWARTTRWTSRWRANSDRCAAWPPTRARAPWTPTSRTSPSSARCSASGPVARARSSSPRASPARMRATPWCTLGTKPRRGATRCRGPPALVPELHLGTSAPGGGPRLPPGPGPGPGGLQGEGPPALAKFVQGRISLRSLRGERGGDQRHRRASQPQVRHLGRLPQGPRRARPGPERRPPSGDLQRDGHLAGSRRSGTRSASCCGSRTSSTARAAPPGRA
jgi:hypothetical protein